jgi:hypothetical protein
MHSEYKKHPGKTERPRISPHYIDYLLSLSLSHLAYGISLPSCWSLTSSTVL